MLLWIAFGHNFSKNIIYIIHANMDIYIIVFGGVFSPQSTNTPKRKEEEGPLPSLSTSLDLQLLSRRPVERDRFASRARIPQTIGMVFWVRIRRTMSMFFLLFASRSLEWRPAPFLFVVFLGFTVCSDRFRVHRPVLQKPLWVLAVLGFEWSRGVIWG